jgi:hypothetical protein
MQATLHIAVYLHELMYRNTSLFQYLRYITTNGLKSGICSYNEALLLAV